jgi:hypothetical protein
MLPGRQADCCPDRSPESQPNVKKSCWAGAPDLSQKIEPHVNADKRHAASALAPPG